MLFSFSIAMSYESLQKRKMLPPESVTNLKQMKQSCQNEGFGTTTSNGTREKQGNRERLANTKMAVVDMELNGGRTSTRTRERLAEAEQKLAEVKTKTSTRTRDDLRRVEEEIAREQARATSNYTMELFERKQEMLRQMLEKNKNVDVVFLLDCTGSMAGYIEEAKNQIKKIVEQILEMYENNVRVAFIGYRDHCDGPMRIETFQFSEDTDKFVTFLSGIRATGGVVDCPTR